MTDTDASLCRRLAPSSRNEKLQWRLFGRHIRRAFGTLVVCVLVAGALAKPALADPPSFAGKPFHSRARIHLSVDPHDDWVHYQMVVFGSGASDERFALGAGVSNVRVTNERGEPHEAEISESPLGTEVHLRFDGSSAVKVAWFQQASSLLRLGRARVEVPWTLASRRHLFSMEPSLVVDYPSAEFGCAEGNVNGAWRCVRSSVGVFEVVFADDGIRRAVVPVSTTVVLAIGWLLLWRRRYRTLLQTRGVPKQGGRIELVENPTYRQTAAENKARTLLAKDLRWLLIQSAVGSVFLALPALVALGPRLPWSPPVCIVGASLWAAFAIFFNSWCWKNEDGELRHRWVLNVVVPGAAIAVFYVVVMNEPKGVLIGTALMVAVVVLLKVVVGLCAVFFRVAKRLWIRFRPDAIAKKVWRGFVGVDIEALRSMQTRNSRTIAEMAMSLGIAESLVHGWRKRLDAKRLNERGESPEQELVRLRRENAELRKAQDRTPSP